MLNLKWWLATSLSSGPEGLRSPYLSYAIAALYQLSYRPKTPYFL